MSFFDTLSQMLVILGAIACGYGANRLGYLGGETDRKISKLLLNITLPAMILGSVSTGDTLPETAVVLGLLKAAIWFYGLEFLLVLLLPRLLGGTPGERGVWRYALAFPNVAFIGYPVSVALFGEEALFYGVILALPFNLLSFTLGPLMLAGAKRFSLRQVLTPTVVASVLGLVLALARLRPPAMVGETLAFIGEITVPLSLLFVGSLLAGVSPGRMLLSPRLWILSVIRLLLLPMALSVLLNWVGDGGLIRGVSVVQMAMPVAVTGSLLCMEHGGDEACMAQLTFMTTLASILTIPIVAALCL